MKYFKMVSGKGRVPMSETEVSNILKGCDEDVLESSTELEKLSERVEQLSKTIEAISQIDIFKTLLSLNERAEDKNGAS